MCAWCVTHGCNQSRCPACAIRHFGLCARRVREPEFVNPLVRCPTLLLSASYSKKAGEEAKAKAKRGDLLEPKPYWWLGVHAVLLDSHSERLVVSPHLAGSGGEGHLPAGTIPQWFSGGADFCAQVVRAGHAMRNSLLHAVLTRPATPAVSALMRPFMEGVRTMHLLPRDYIYEYKV